MGIVINYGNNIQYDPGTSDFLKLQKLSVALALHIYEKDIGEIRLVEPSNVNLEYNTYTGIVTVNSKIGSVSHIFSTEYEAQMKQPLQEAISLLAKFELIKRLASSATQNIKAIIHHNHTNFMLSEQNLTKMNSTLAEINVTLNETNLSRSHSANFGLFSHAPDPLKTKMDRAVAALVKGEIHGQADVEKLLPLPEDRPEQHVRSSQSGAS